MGKKGRKTRWRKLPIPIGNGQRKTSADDEEDDSAPKAAPPPSRTTFNEDEYTKITTPRQDMLFKKGYLGRKKTTTTTPASQDTTDAQSADSVESEQYCCEEQIPQYMYPAPTGYIDHTGIYYVPNYEVYDPYTGGLTVVVGPAPQFPGPHPVLATLPCTPVPLQSVEWFAPPPPPPPAHTPQYNGRKKSSNSIDSQNWSGQSSESTCPPGSPQDPAEQCEIQPYAYPGYMFGPPVYSMNGVNVQGVVPTVPAQPPSDPSKRRKKRRRRRRGGVTDEGSESSCEEVCSLEAPGSSASSSKTNSDSGIATDPCGASNGQGSLSSLSNDEADKDKSIPSEVDSPTTETKEEVAEEKPVEESNTVVECDHLTTFDNAESEAVPQDKVTAEEPEAVEEAFEQSIDIADKSEETEIIPLEDEGNAETTEAFSDYEFEEKENLCSSDESTLPCTADDHSIEDCQIEEDLVIRISGKESESRLQEDNLEEDEVITGFNDLSMYDLNHLELETVPVLPPVAPPRRKKCAKVAEKLAGKLADEIVSDALSCAAVQRWPITSAVTKWLEDSEDEIEEAEEATGQKNGEGNPFPAPSHSGTGTRVASNEWYNSRVREMCDPITSVNKYYRLALPIKTGPGPFPCGVCCIIQ